MIKLDNISKDQKYVVAVSGGVDSMVLLALLVKKLDSDNLVVAHYRHNVRDKVESDKDLAVIDTYCKNHNLELVVGSFDGSDKSENAMREARYAFLKGVESKKHYNHIITAHHQDDLVETAIINLLRGTKGRGLYAISSNSNVVRPLLNSSKPEILKYAKANNINWHEDSTNNDDTILRNYVRHQIIPKLISEGKLEDFKTMVFAQKPIEEQIETVLNQTTNAKHLRYQDLPFLFSRPDFIVLPHIVAKRLIHKWLSSSDLQIETNNDLIEKIVIFAKTAQFDSSIDLSKRLTLQIKREHLVVLEKA